MAVLWFGPVLMPLDQDDLPFIDVNINSESLQQNLHDVPGYLFVTEAQEKMGHSARQWPKIYHL